MNRLARIIKRNYIDLNGKSINKNNVTLEWWNGRDNVGDYMSNVVYNWMTRDIECFPKKKGIHLMTIGSLIGGGNFDSIIWGSGILNLDLVKKVYNKSWLIKYDVRAVRGPLTKEVLVNAGYNCDNIAMGDPAILMPLIYKGRNLINEKKYKYCVINHYVNENKKYEIPNSICVSAGTIDYKKFIDTILESEMVISSSLHGIILAEAYGVPAIYCCNNLEKSLFKVFDYYFSTGRYSVVIAKSVEDALKISPMFVPDFSHMQEQLIKAFPRDIWK